MHNKMILPFSLAAFLLVISLPSFAKATPEELAHLGQDLTPIGAKMAGNADGSIPPWNGGITQPPAGFDVKKGWLDPFSADKPLFTITAANAAQYRDKLAPGQLALLQKYPEYKMNIYPTRRSAGYPQTVYDAVKAEAANADTANGGNNVINVSKSSVPFPLPKNGVEVIWNNAFRYRTRGVVRYQTNFPVQANGAFTPLRSVERLFYPISMEHPPENLLFMYRATFTAPSSIAGENVLIHESIDQVKQPRKAWVYNPGSRRVLRAPEIAYDNPSTGSDALATTDDYDGYNGAPDRYDFKLLGTREMYIAYNNYKLTDKSLKYSEIIKPNVINQDLVRYELHRVWVVEGTLKPGASHIYAKRVFFVDEDSWQIAHGDQYDGRGELWRVKELYGVQYYDAPTFWMAGTSQYDLQSRRYYSSALTNEEPPIEWNAALGLEDFSTGVLKRN
ncbi:DUF1329 domain-containing protein [Pseudomonas sp. ICMP22404]|uniref:DUF1329 domain-containing protein n=1 Tax=Pseudomonas sp. ICMP22404 TaxID=2583807 RepID=UPI00111BC8A2|nr:DUF1329 domain-containing protein [Pseudomonas sp. ICMP22404]TNF83357.1 DUF1329 domain-containing protein [Pseudomonas sp. ICMP22404]